MQKCEKKNVKVHFVFRRSFVARVGEPFGLKMVNRNWIFVLTWVWKFL